MPTRTRSGVIGIACLVLLLLPGIILALGPSNPPRITWVQVYVDKNPQNNGGLPYLNVGIGVETPGGNMPLSIQSVTVSVPTTPTPTTVTVPIDRLDLSTEDGFYINLTSAGLGQGVFPVGTYTATVTDTAGGVSTASDTFSTPTILDPPSSITITGLVPVNSNLGGYNLLNTAATPSPTISWAPVTGAQNYRVRVRNGFNDQDLFRWQPGNASTTSVTVPDGVFRPGRRYFIRVEAYDQVNGFGCTPVPPATSCITMDANARSRNQIEVVTPGPELYVTIGCTNCTGTPAAGPFLVAGSMLKVRARIFNTALPTDVIVEGWIHIPGGGIYQYLPPFLWNVPVNVSGDVFPWADVWTYTFGGGEPAGLYTAGIRFRDPQTGETIAVATRTFRFN
jgi:hypothetical protein